MLKGLEEHCSREELYDTFLSDLFDLEESFIRTWYDGFKIFKHSSYRIKTDNKSLNIKGKIELLLPLKCYLLPIKRLYNNETKI